MTGLQTIYLNNSFYEGMRVRIKCDSHTNLLGGNGAGKTSVLRLIPVFYGYEPNRLMVRAASKKNFTDYYLPNKQSMIVFEYVRATGETCCAVLFRRDAETGYAYRLIAGAASETVFHPALNPLYDDMADVNTIMQNLHQLTGVKPTAMINLIVDYRAIIQNDLSGSNKRKSGVDLRALSGQYSLVSRSKMQHIHSLTTVSLSKSQRIARLKEMIVDSMLSKGADVGSPPADNKNEGIWKDLRSLSSFLSNEPQIKTALNDYAQIQANRSDLVFAQRRIVKLRKLGETKAYEIKDEIQRVRGEIDSSNELFTKNNSELTFQQSKHAGSADQIKDQIKLLYSTKTEFEQTMKMPHWLAEYEREPHYKNELSDAKGRLELYQADSLDIVEKAESRKHEISVERDKRVKAINQDRDRINAKLLTVQDRHEGGIKQLEANREAECEAKASDNVVLAQALDSELDALREKADDAGAQTQEESKRLTETEEHVLKLKNALKAARRVEAVKESESDNASRENNTAQRNFDEASNQHSRAASERDELNRLLHPLDGSLLAFLRESGHDWEQTLGKTINPDLLSRKDLQPRITGASNTADFFGIELDLEQLSIPDQAQSEAVLTEQFSRACRNVIDAKENLENCERKWKATQRAEDDKGKEAQAAKMEVTKLNASVEQAESELREVRASIETEIGKRKAVFKEKIKQLDSQHRAAKGKAAEELKTIERRYKRQHDTLIANMEAEREEIKKTLSLYSEQISEANLYVKAEHEKIDASVAEQLSDAGLDPKTISNTEREVRELQTRIDSVAAQHTNIHRYQSWLSSDWSRLADLKEKLTSHNEKIQFIQKEISEAQAKHETEQETLKNRVNTLSAEAAALGQKAATWSSTESWAQRTIDNIPESTEPDAERVELQVSLDLGDAITHNLSKLTHETDELSDKVLRALDKSNRAILQNPDSHIYEKWQYLTNARNVTQTRSEKAGKLAAMDDLKRLMEYDVPEIREALIQSVRSAGGRMARYHEELSGISSQVRHISRILETKLNTEHEFDDFSNIEVRLISKVEEFDYWPTLKAFSNEWSGWAASRANELPPNSLQQHLELLDGMFNRARMDQNDISSLVELEINITEKGQQVKVRNDYDLEHLSSEGLTSIAIMVIFAALTRYLCPDENVSIIWPIDELGRIHPDNVGKLFTMMTNKNIVILSAQPTASHEFLKRYKHCYQLDENFGVRDFISVQRDSASNPLRKLLAQSDTQEANQEVAVNE